MQMAIIMLLVLCGLFFVPQLQPSIRPMEYIDLSVDGRINNSISSIVSIDKAHSNALSHRGIWMLIVDEHEELLLLKRHHKAVTCPGTWSAAGEHTKYQEEFIDTAYRGMLEELGLRRQQILSIQQLTPTPLWLYVKYDDTGQKSDVQWTASFLVRVNRRDIAKFNTESSLSQWVPIRRFEQWSGAHADVICKVSSFQYKNQSTDVAQDTDFRSMLDMHVRLVRPYLHNPVYTVRR